MNDQEQLNNPRFNLLYVAIAVVGLLAVMSVLNSVRVAFRPALGSAVAVEKPAHPKARVAIKPMAPVVRQTAWQPTTLAAKQQAALEQRRSEPERLQLAQIRNFRAKQAAQMERLRQDRAENAGDDLDQTLSEEEISAMQADGVMAW